jgi:hypothetical protein
MLILLKSLMRRKQKIRKLEKRENEGKKKEKCGKKKK